VSSILVPSHPAPAEGWISADYPHEHPGRAPLAEALLWGGHQEPCRPEAPGARVYGAQVVTEVKALACQLPASTGVPLLWVGAAQSWYANWC
jgi:hypothetical protein